MKVTLREISFLQKNDRRAQKEIFIRAYPLILSICKCYTSDSMLAEDAASTAFIKAFKGVDGFLYHSETSFYQWIRVIAIREVLYSLRKGRDFLSLDADMAVDISMEPSVFEKMEYSDIMALLMRIPEAQRAVFLLHIMEGYKHDEIALLLNISESNSKVLLHRAKTSLKAIYLNEIRRSEGHGKMGS